MNNILATNLSRMAGAVTKGLAVAAVGLFLGNALTSEANAYVQVDVDITNGFVAFAPGGGLTGPGPFSGLNDNLLVGAFDYEISGNASNDAIKYWSVDIDLNTQLGPFSTDLDLGSLAWGDVQSFLFGIVGACTGGGFCFLDGGLDMGDDGSFYFAFPGTATGPLSGFVAELLSQAPSGFSTSFDGTLTFQAPEPAAIAMFGLGLVGLGFAHRRKAAA